MASTLNRVFTNFVVVFVSFIASLIFVPSPFLPDIKPEEFKVKLLPLRGAFQLNDELDKVEKIYENKLFGAECLDERNGAFYTGLSDGRIVKLENGNVETIFRSGGINCDKKPEGCGSPRGLRFDQNGDLIVADMKNGVYKIKVEKGEKTQLYSMNHPIDGKEAKGTNHLDVGRNGDVYVSDISTKWDGNSFLNEFFEVAPNGRVLHYNAATKTTESLIDNLYFPNGVQLSSEEDFLLIAQTTKYNILKLHLKGPKKGQVETFIDNLPGMPDNIHRTKRGTFWIALVGIRYEGKATIPETFASYPLVRKVIGRLIFVTDLIFQWGLGTVQNEYLHRLYSRFQSLKFDLVLGPHHGIAFEADSNGKIIRSLHSPSGHVQRLSHAFEFNDHLYTASPFEAYIGKLKIKKTH